MKIQVFCGVQPPLHGINSLLAKVVLFLETLVIYCWQKGSSQDLISLTTTFLNY